MGARRSDTTGTRLCACAGDIERSSCRRFSDLDRDVRQSIARIKASPFIPLKAKIRGFGYDVKTGRLREAE